MARFNGYIAGQWLVTCDRCGWVYHSADLRKEWNGLMTCHGGNTNKCWEERPKQDFVKGRADKQAPPWVRPEPEDDFI